MPYRSFPLTLRQWLVTFWLVSLFTLAASFGNAAPPLSYALSEQKLRIAQLEAEFGQHKAIPDAYRLQILLALSHFPELKDVSVEFIVTDTRIPVSSRPRPTSILSNRLKRNYIVVIAEDPDQPQNPLLLANQPFGAQVGILGHELAHTADYITKGGFGILGDAFCQLSNKCRIRFERATDRRLIDHGLGWLRIEHAAFVRQQFRQQGRESTGGGGAYMGPDELLAIMAQHPLYQPVPCCTKLAQAETGETYYCAED